MESEHWEMKGMDPQNQRELNISRRGFAQKHDTESHEQWVGRKIKDRKLKCLNPGDTGFLSQRTQEILNNGV